MNALRIGLVCALPEEVKMLSPAKLSAGDILLVEDNLLIGVAGMGQQCATLMAERLADEGAALLISWGFAGSVSSDADRSGLILPKQIVTASDKYEVDGDTWQQFYQALSAENVENVENAELKINTGRIFTSEEIVRTRHAKILIHEKYQVDSVDMESAAIARVAAERNIKLLVIRAVTDTSTQALPDYIGSTTRLGNVLFNLIKQPSTLGAVFNLGIGYRKALKSLGKARVILYNQYYPESA